MDNVTYHKKEVLVVKGVLVVGGILLLGAIVALASVGSAVYNQQAERYSTFNDWLKMRHSDYIDKSLYDMTCSTGIHDGTKCTGRAKFVAEGKAGYSIKEVSVVCNRKDYCFNYN